jgi:hypothetical protein
MHVRTIALPGDDAQFSRARMEQRWPAPRARRASQKVDPFVFEQRDGARR